MSTTTILKIFLFATTAAIGCGGEVMSDDNQADNEALTTAGNKILVSCEKPGSPGFTFDGELNYGFYPSVYEFGETLQLQGNPEFHIDLPKDNLRSGSAIHYVDATSYVGYPSTGKNVLDFVFGNIVVATVGSAKIYYTLNIEFPQPGFPTARSGVASATLFETTSSGVGWNYQTSCTFSPAN
jgi:hypothetical protein